MKPRPDQEQLLSDVLASGADIGFREALLGETLLLARRRRQWRQARRGVTTLVVLALAATGVWWALLPDAAEPWSAMGCQVVHSQPLRPDELVATKPLAPDQLIASVATKDMVITVSGGFREIGDDELLALAAPQVAALVRRGPHEAELILVQANPPSSETH
jgi:hypothetical protein